MSLPRIAIVTPSLADANNGNWRTAHRWQSLLAGKFSAILHNGPEADLDVALMIALHARRSAGHIRRFKEQFPQRPLAVVLTGTDLYHDLAENTDAQRSIELADALIVLQEDAIRHIPLVMRRKAHVVYQSATPLTPAAKAHGKLGCVVVGHLRAEKSPETIFRLVESLPHDMPVHVLHIGAELDRASAALATRARKLDANHYNYRWAGAMPHGLTRAAIKRAHLLIHPSIMEGGANVIVEAITAGTPVLASRMSGNIGMLGHKYPGYFPVGDDKSLLALLRRSLNEPNLLMRLKTACDARAKLFLPETERRSLGRILDTLLAR